MAATKVSAGDNTRARTACPGMRAVGTFVSARAAARAPVVPAVVQREHRVEGGMQMLGASTTTPAPPRRQDHDRGLRSVSDGLARQSHATNLHAARADARELFLHTAPDPPVHVPPRLSTTVPYTSRLHS
jgi:hypothetical protein